MKRLLLSLFMCITVSVVFAQTGFKQLQFYTQMMDGSAYWESMHQYFMKEHQYRYACITCPSSEPESCLLIGDSTLTIVTLDKMIYSYLRDKKLEKKPKISQKTLSVSKRFVIDLCNLIDLGSLTSDAYETSRMTDGSTTYFLSYCSTTYFLSYSQIYHSSKTRAKGSANGGNEASQLMRLLNQIRDAVIGKCPFVESDLMTQIHNQHKHLFTLLPSNFADREMYDLY